MFFVKKLAFIVFFFLICSVILFIYLLKLKNYEEKNFNFGLFVAMMLGAAQINATDATVMCVNYHNHECSFTAQVCGSTFNEMQAEARIWDEIHCN